MFKKLKGFKSHRSDGTGSWKTSYNGEPTMILVPRGAISDKEKFQSRKKKPVVRREAEEPKD